MGGISFSGRTNLGEMRVNTVVAVFRDPQTVEAVASAPPIVRLFLEEAGFGVKVAQDRHDSMSQPIEDPEMRRVLVKQLSSALGNKAMKKALGRVAHETTFNVHEFIASVVEKKSPRASSDQAYDGPVADDLDDLADNSKVRPRSARQVRQKAAQLRARPA